MGRTCSPCRVGQNAPESLDRTWGPDLNPLSNHWGGAHEVAIRVAPRAVIHPPEWRSPTGSLPRANGSVYWAQQHPLPGGHVQRPGQFPLVHVRLKSTGIAPTRRLDTTARPTFSGPSSRPRNTHHGGISCSAGITLPQTVLTAAAAAPSRSAEIAWSRFTASNTAGHAR